MKIQLIKEKEKTEINIEKGMTLEELAIKTGPYPYKILLARVNGRDCELTEKPEEDDRIEFLDMRTYSAELTYQRGLSMLYLVAVRDVMIANNLCDTKTEIDNSLNKGFFTLIKPVQGASEETFKAVKNGISDSLLEQIQDRMKQLVEMDLPIIRETVSVEEGIRYCREAEFAEKTQILEAVEDSGMILPLYRIDVPVGDEIKPYRNHFYGPMVPSLGYIDLYELRNYENGVLLRFPYHDKPDEIPEYRDDKKMYEAFREEHEWLKLLKTEFLPDMNNVIGKGGARDMILLSEALHEKKIAEISDRIKEGGKRIVLIAGPSSSGKTTFARRLCIQLRVNGLNPLYMGTDDYFVNREDTPLDENGEKNYENLSALDINLFNSNMNDLLAGKETDLPEYDFIQGVKVFGKRITKIGPDTPIVIEGIHALNRKLTAQIDDREIFRIYISPLTQLNIDLHNRVPTCDARMIRRMVRDYKFRNYSAKQTITEWPKVRAGEDINIFPYNGEADVLFNSTLAYETCLLKKYAEPLLREIGEDEPEYSEAQRLLKLMQFFGTIENENYVPNNSILREFIGGSVFTE